MSVPRVALSYMFPFHIGGHVDIDADLHKEPIRGKIAAIIVYDNGKVEFKVCWFNGAAHNEYWFPADRLTQAT